MFSEELEKVRSIADFDCLLINVTVGKFTQDKLLSTVHSHKRLPFTSVLKPQDTWCELKSPVNITSFLQEANIASKHLVSCTPTGKYALTKEKGEQPGRVMSNTIIS